MIRTKTYTAKNSKTTHTKLNEFLELSRELYNAGLEYRNNRYQKTGESVSYYDLCKDLTEIRKEYPEFAKYDNLWAIATNANTCADVYTLLEVGQNKTAVVVKINEYYGYYDRTLWDKLNAWGIER